MGTRGFNEGKHVLSFLVVIMVLQGAFSLLSDFDNKSVGLPLYARKNRNLSFSFTKSKHALESKDRFISFALETSSSSSFSQYLVTSFWIVAFMIG